LIVKELMFIAVNVYYFILTMNINQQFCCHDP
jgi:hypothetical protein